MNAAEDRLAELMEAATRNLDPPIESLLAEGVRLGVSRRRRRRAVVAGGTAAAVLLAAAGAAAALRAARNTPSEYAAGSTAAGIPATRAPTGADATAPNPSATSTASPFPDPAGLPTSVYGGVPLMPIDARAAVAILKSLTGADWFFGPYLPSSPGSLLRVDVNDGKGLAQVFVDVAPDAKSGMDPISCAKQNQALALKIAALQPSCSEVEYSNGDRAMQQILAGTGGENMYRIIVNRSDGVAVEITVANGDSTSQKTLVTRPTPPLSLQEWTKIALNRAWQVRVPKALDEG